MENSKTLVRKCYTNEMYQEAERNTLTMKEKTMKEREEILKENISINAWTREGNTLLIDSQSEKFYWLTELENP